MRVHYRAIDGGNFGDDLNLELWPELFPDLDRHDPDVVLYGIGTILGGDHDPRARKVVLGSGLGYRRTPRLDDRWDVRWVRGVHTAWRLRLPPEKALGDAALLWSALRTPAGASGAVRDGVGLVPHHATWSAFDWPAVAAAAGLRAVDPTAAPRAVAEAVRRCTRVLTESLHGAIFADAMGVPWAPCVLSHRFNDFKWRDWSEGIGRPFAPCVADRPLVRALGRGKGWTNRLARWSGLGGRSRRNALRPVGPSPSLDAERVAAQLAAFAAGEARFACSDPAQVARQRERMLQACAEFARDYGLRFGG